MAFSSRSSDRTDALARLQSEQPPWMPTPDAVVVGPDRDLGESLGGREVDDPHLDDLRSPLHPGSVDPRSVEPGSVEPGGFAPHIHPPADASFRTPATPLWLDTSVIGTAGPTQVDRRWPWPDDDDRPRQWPDDEERPRPDRRHPADGDEPVPRGRSSRSRGLPMVPPAAIALVVVGVIACLVTAYTLASGSGDDAPTAVAFPSTAGAASTAAHATDPGGDGDGPAPGTSGAPAASPAQVVVSVVGLVRTPGLVHLAASARIADAIAKAGGGRPGADLLSLNMAQPVRDGDQILVGFVDPGGSAAMRSAVVAAGTAPGTTSGAHGSGVSAPDASGAPSPGSGGATGPVVDLNTADATALDSLPGVGPVTAAAIIDWRTRNGGFTSVDQLAEVDGIGPGRLAKLRDRVRV